MPPNGSLVAIDTETTGLDYSVQDFAVVGIGLATEDTCIYIDVTELTNSERLELINILQTYELIAHNVAYDAGALKRFSGDYGQWKWKYCTYGLYKQIANEGYPGQSWGLKQAQQDLLGWQESNDEELRDWLIANGYTIGRNKPDLSKMYLSPVGILGKYCALDASACWQLYKLLYKQVLCEPEFKALKYYHCDIFIPNTVLIAEQQIRGIEINIEQLKKHKFDLENRMRNLMDRFLTHSETKQYIDYYNNLRIEEFLGTEPRKYKKNGEVASNWQKWKDKYIKFKNKNHFNVNSKQQLEWLLFDCIGYEPVKKTESGRRSVDKKSLPFFGEPGKLLLQYNKLLKEHGYVESCLNCTKDGVLHPMFRSPGTKTGRISSGGKGGKA